MTAVMRHLRTGRRGWPPTAWWPRAAAVAAGAALVALTSAWFDAAPSTVPAVVVDNPGGRNVTIAVRSADDASTLVLGQVPAGGRAVFHEVLDQGDDWMVMLGYGSVSAGEVRVDREQLEAGWTVPEAVTRHFDRGAEGGGGAQGAGGAG